MKKVLICALAALVAALFILWGCSDGKSYAVNSEERIYTVIYLDRGETAFTEYVKEGCRAPNKILKGNDEYRFGGWNYRQLPYDFLSGVREDMTLTAKWSPIDYHVEFVCDGKVISVQRYNAEDKDVTPPEIPKADGFTARWESYELGGGNIRVNAVYSPVEYTVTFIAGDKTVNKVNYTVYDKEIEIPDVPEVEFYEGVWEEFNLEGGDKEVRAYYSPRLYSVDFYADGNFVDSRGYDIEHKKIAPPAVPEKAHYDGSWEDFSLDGGDVKVNANYVPHKYSITFLADGQEVDRLYYDIESGVTPPAVPEKYGYKGAWEDFALDGGDKTVNAVYSYDMPQEEAGTEGLIYGICAGGFKITGYEGAAGDVVIPSFYNGEPVVEIAANAFSENWAITSFTAGKNLKIIGENAFYNCINLAAINLGGVESLGANAFVCTAVTSVAIPDTVGVIPEYAFYGCKNLVELTVPDSIKSIGKMALGGCVSLENLTLGAGLESIEANAFAKCDSLKSVVFADSRNWFLVKDGNKLEMSGKFSSPETAARELKTRYAYAFVKSA